ncbi:MAG TPA: glycoside hydrolase family 32 protein [Bryobacteraceae bacterium]|nr:glycoside hydrolase family 32 protein [Bryobacteraceae bacterium]
MTRRRFHQQTAAALLGGVQAARSQAPGQETRDREFFYRPAGAWAADFIPFYSQSRFRLFYLLDWRNKEKFGEGTPWYQISTDDFVHFTEHGEMLPRGGKQDQDLYVFTGSVIEALGRYHIFYTGHNPYFRAQGRPEQGIMHAVSDDLLHWTKIPADTFYAPQAAFEPHDWRDPFVFWNEEAREYWMLTAARLKAGPSRRRGCTALCASRDLRTWQVREPFWAPGLYYTHECPDLFRMGDWWYLVYSTFTERSVTHYRMSRSLKGPWLAPENDTFDGRAFYAAKTASDGRRRFVFGWNPTREESKDYRRWNWGGNLVVHEVVQEPDGSLCVSVPHTVDAAFSTPAPFQFRPGLRDCRIGRDSVRILAPDSFGCAPAGRMPRRCKIEARVQFDEHTRGCGLMLRATSDLESAYYIRLEPGRNRLVFDSWPRAGDVPFMVELERPLPLTPGTPVDLKVFVDGTVCVVYAAGKLAMNTRLYNLPEGDWGVFVNEGAAQFRNLALSTTA